MLLRALGTGHRTRHGLFGGKSCFSRTEGLPVSVAAVRGLRSHLCLQSSRSRLSMPGLGDRSCYGHHPVRLRAAMETNRAFTGGCDGSAHTWRGMGLYRWSLCLGYNSSITLFPRSRLCTMSPAQEHSPGARTGGAYL